MRAKARQPRATRERRCRNLQPVQARAQLQEELGVEAGADLAREDEALPFEVAHQQRAQSDARASWLGEPTNDQLLPHLALHLQPVRRPAMLVAGVASLGDDALPTFTGGAL